MSSPPPHCFCWWPKEFSHPWKQQEWLKATALALLALSSEDATCLQFVFCRFILASRSDYFSLILREEFAAEEEFISMDGWVPTLPSAWPNSRSVCRVLVIRGWFEILMTLILLLHSRCWGLNCSGLGACAGPNMPTSQLKMSALCDHWHPNETST